MKKLKFNVQNAMTFSVKKLSLKTTRIPCTKIKTWDQPHLIRGNLDLKNIKFFPKELINNPIRINLDKTHRAHRVL